MLPYTPLHTLLFAASGEEAPPLHALVMTSGNRSEEPIAIENEEALGRLATLADAFLLHDRPIHVRCDDSVTRLFRGKEMVLRRSRGYAPFPVRLGAELPSVLAVGGELKNTFCLTRENYAFLSQHVGDLENAETLSSFEQGIDHFRRLFRVAPEAVAHDLHPEYLSTKWATEQVAAGSGPTLTGLPLIPVQHHHAHLAACLAENSLRGPAIGVSWDGTGYGADGAIWGGEFLAGDFAGFRRLAHLKYVPLPGGEAAIRRPYRTALSHLVGAFGDAAWRLDLPFARAIDSTELAVIRHQIATGLNSPLTSSAGRLFDAVAALLDIRGVVNYEGQAAIEMETLAAQAPGEPPYPLAETLAGRGLVPPVLPATIDAAPLIRAVVSDIHAGVPPALIAARFHASIAALIAAVCGIIAGQEGLSDVCLSGGVFQNMLLLEQTVDLLAGSGLAVHTHHQVPANDGGLALGQAVIAATILQRSRSNS